MNDETTKAPETADMPPAENASVPVSKQEPKREKREIHPTQRKDWVPRDVRMQRHLLRAMPKAKQVRVLRSWQGVRNGQIVVLHPAELKRRLASRMVEVVNAQ